MRFKGWENDPSWTDEEDRALIQAREGDRMLVEEIAQRKIVNRTEDEIWMRLAELPSVKPHIAHYWKPSTRKKWEY